jgi:HEAT repeat protein
MESQERDSLFADLGHDDEEIRRLAVERLSLLPPDEATGPLVECLGDSSWRVRKAAVERLTAFSDASGPVRALVPALADGENPGRRNAALEALTRFGAAALPVLIEASHDTDVDVRKQTVDALAAIGTLDAAAEDRLAELLEDTDPNVRAAAAEALGAIGARDAAPLLMARVDADREPLVRLSALRSLARLEVSLTVSQLELALEDPLLRSSAYLLLGWSEDRGAFDALLKGLSSAARSAREAAMEALVKRASLAPPGEDQLLGERLRAAVAEVPFLSDALRRLSEAPLTTRLVLVQFLGWLGRPDCVIPLLEAGRDEALSEVVLGALSGAGPEAEASVNEAWGTLSDATRIRACALLGRTRGETGEALLRRALTHGDPALRAVAAGALASRGATAALPALVAALRVAATTMGEAGDADADGQAELEQAIRALLAGADTAVCDRVAALLEAEIDGAPEAFRLATARLLGCIACPGHRERVELLLSDPSAAVRRAAVEALAQVAPQQLEPLRCALADESPQVRIGAATALAASGDAAAVADLASLLDDDEPRVVVAALRALATWALAAGSDEARERALLLLSVGLAHGGSSGLAALDALSAIGGDDAVELAKDALGSADPEIAEAAIACVGAHGGRAALTNLLPRLEHAAWNVRARVAQVMEERRHVHAIPSLIRQLDAERDDFVRGAILAALATLESQ